MIQILKKCKYFDRYDLVWIAHLLICCIIYRHSPEFLLMENVIVVTVNFRLHILGFLSLPEMGIPGNTGLKDQQMALEWIFENISYFNGDPENICLFGESAGAVCVNFHVLNQRSRKCINSAICQSGTVFSERYFQVHSEERIKILAKRLGCKSESLADIYETLMSAPAKDLYDNCDVRIGIESSLGFKNKWRMVIEKESNDAFITKSSLDSVISQAGQINFPIMCGTNSGDGIPTAAKLVARKMLDLANIRDLIPRSICSQTNEVNGLLELIKQFYFKNRNLSEVNVTELVVLLSDLHYLIDQTKSNELHARYHPQSKLFLYEFQFDGKLNIQKKLAKMQHIALAAHADDVFYLFGGVLVDKVKLTEDSREWKMRKTMCKLWTNFAKYGDPTPDGNNPLSVKWHAVQPFNGDSNDIDFDYLVINDDVKLVRNLNKDRIDFWRKYLKWNEDCVKARL